MTSDDHVLLGAYVLHALTDDERAAFRNHLRACAQCRQDAHELRTTAAWLGQATAATPPPELRDRVLRRIAHTRQPRRWLRGSI